MASWPERRGRLNVKSAVMLVSFLMISGVTQAADEIEPLDVEFLDYLANMEGDDDDWTLLATEQPGVSSEPASKPATREATEEAAQTAVERR